MTDFFHGVEVIQIDDGVRPIETVKSSVIGIVGTAHSADDDVFPINTPVLIPGNRSIAAKLDTLSNQISGSLPSAVDAILDQAGASIIVVRVMPASKKEDRLANIIGGIDKNGKPTGMQALLAAESQLGVTPRILIAPEFTHEKIIVDELLSVAERLKAIVFADGPNTTNEAAINYRGQFDSKRLMIIDPWVKTFNKRRGEFVTKPASSFFAGLQAKIDHDKGFWHSVSNHPILGVLETARPIDSGGTESTANLLNDNEVSTIIRDNGFRSWGNRTTSIDPKWAFLTTVRVADMINDSIKRAHQWAVDRNITRTYLEDVVEGVKAYIRELKNLEAIIDGDAWVDPEMNTQTTLAKGQVFIDFDFKEHPLAERITFRSHLNNAYLTQVLPIDN